VAKRVLAPIERQITLSNAASLQIGAERRPDAHSLTGIHQASDLQEEYALKTSPLNSSCNQKWK